jgi:hypothetical protein
MDFRSGLYEKVPMIGLCIPICPEEPEGSGSTVEIDCIQLGASYAEAIRLWRV